MATLLTGSSAPQNAPIQMHQGAPAFGEFLRRARERRGLTLQQISSETRIPKHHLDALEQGNLTALPGGFYRRAEVRAYAQAVHLDQYLALAQLERALEAPVALEAASDTQRTRWSPHFSGSAAVTIGVVVATAVLGLAAWNRRPAADDRPQAQPATRSQEPPTAAPAPQPAPDASLALGRGEQIDRAVTPSEDLDGGLIVITDPPGARVTVDGIGWGITPVTIRYLPLGDKRIRLTKDGYAAEERVVRLGEDRPTIRLRLALRSAP